MRFGLDDKKIEKLTRVISQSKGIKKAVIFGSRARGDYQYNSDIDIAIYADGETTPGLVSNINEAAGIYKTNVILMNNLGNEDLRINIEKDGVEIYKRDK